MIRRRETRRVLVLYLSRITNCFFVVLVLVVLDIGINSSAHGIKSQDGGVIVRGL